MARGWESKSIQDQIDSAESRNKEKRLVLTPEQLAELKKRESLLLHRTRVLRDIETCKDERYRKTLTEGLEFLEAQLAGLGWRP